MLTTKSLFEAEGLDDRSLEFLTQALERNNLPGFDYLEFKRAVAQLIAMNIDEATAYKSAFTTASTMGLTKEKLIETAGYYRNLIEKEQTQFSQALENQNATKVAGRQNEVARLKDQIERHKADIIRLQDEMAGYLTQVEQAETATKTEAEKLDKAKTAFESTNKAVLLQMDKDIENLHKLL
jgi:molecular chaperone GrpE (heat shock protein)